jgi:hypothetical protein
VKICMAAFFGGIASFLEASRKEADGSRLP